MQSQKQFIAPFLTTLVCAILTLAAAAPVSAQETQSDPTGTWTWSTPRRDGGTPRETTLKLKKEGEKLTGELVSPGRQGGEPRHTAIQNGKIKGDEISFTVTREFNANTVTQKYLGKLSGDSIKGKIEMERGGETQSRDWVAKRASAKTDKAEPK